MVIALLLLAGWVVLNVLLLSAVAIANHRGQRTTVRVPAARPVAARAIATTH